MFPTCEALGFMSTRPTAALSHPAPRRRHRRSSPPLPPNCVGAHSLLLCLNARSQTYKVWFKLPDREQGRVMDFAMKAPVILDLPKCRNVSGISSGRWPSRSATSAFVTRLNLEPAHFRTSGAKGGYFCKLVCSRWKYHITFTAMFFLVWEMI